MIKTDILENKLKTIINISNQRIDEKIINKFKEYLLGFGDEKPEKLNPFTFSGINGISKKDSVSLFIYATKVGVFDFKWVQICPVCGGIHSRHETINSLDKKSYYCYMCNLSNEAALDDWIEVSFDLNSGLFEQKTPKEFPIQQWSYADTFFSPNVVYTDELKAFISSCSKGFTTIDPEEIGELSFIPEEGNTYKIISFEIHSAIWFENVSKSKDNTPYIHDIEMTERSFVPSCFDIYATKTTFRLKNMTGKKAGVILVEVKPEFSDILEKNKSFKPFLTGKMLLNNQSFRDLFRSDYISPDLSLTIKDLTILFTDLKGSTSMYGRIGDIKAFDLVNKHFDILRICVDKNNGSVVKTIGDAVMASFNDPLDGFNAAWEMNEAILNFNNEIKSENRLDNEDIAIKIGLNSGHALAVNLNNRIDYFGQAVNIAARVQGLANAGEIWISDQIYNNNHVQKRIDEYKESGKFEVNKSIAQLKGVTEEQVVYQIKIVG